jgi:hypothetical protein
MLDRMIEFSNGEGHIRTRWQGNDVSPPTPPGYHIQRLNFCWIEAPDELVPRIRQYLKDTRRRWRTTGYFDKQQFNIMISRQIDRLFVERNLPFTCVLSYFPLHGPQQDFTQRRPEDTFDATFDYFLNYFNTTGRRLFSDIIIHSNNNANPDPNYTEGFIFSTDGDYVGIDVRQFFRQMRKNIVFSLQLTNFWGTDEQRRKTVSNLDEFLPTVDDAIKKILYLKFDPVSKSILYPLALTTRFEDLRGSEVDRPTRSTKRLTEANDFNESNRQTAITALGIVGANQMGLRYFSGISDPRQLLARSRETDFQLLRQ